MTSKTMYTESKDLVYLSPDQFDINKLTFGPPELKKYDSGNESVTASVKYQTNKGKQSNLIFNLKDKPLTGIFRKYKYQEKDESPENATGYFVCIPLRNENYQNMNDLNDDEKLLFEIFDKIAPQKFVNTMKEYNQNKEWKDKNKLIKKWIESFSKSDEEIFDHEDPVFKPVWQYRKNKDTKKVDYTIPPTLNIDLVSYNKIKGEKSVGDHNLNIVTTFKQAKDGRLVQLSSDEVIHGFVSNMKDKTRPNPSRILCDLMIEFKDVCFANTKKSQICAFRFKVVQCNFRFIARGSKYDQSIADSMYTFDDQEDDQETKKKDEDVFMTPIDNDVPDIVSVRPPSLSRSKRIVNDN